ncbi:DJ-1/PfpI family protein [Amycolatopsis sp. PS_44_ISF1]|uniref:DJ-1/PfpI family protein n=1 Tax=Amycolatopsis sp. PS_44_ISF1 TaxID=2974917 RepID=UPI0028DF09B8|nr:DJ-1/PfpI family protein [Amycolatopsis sp. PS_44_ISF1]MDT8913425.1 DJ-1/PfpI family protein [Amycolatopsis sp. PS_44_ISF1]
MLVAIAAFPRMTALDAVGPYEVLQRLPALEVVFVGERRGEVRTENGFLGLTVDATYAEVPAPDVVVVPGGVGTRAQLDGGALLDWTRETYAGTRFTTSVCTGSLILAAAGLLDGLEATTHWSAVDTLAELGAKPVTRRVVEHPGRRLVVAAGVSAGIDMALRLAELLVDTTAAKAAQTLIEYDPEPPFDAGHPSKVDAQVMARVDEYRALRA